MAKEEQVLVVEREVIEKVGIFNGVEFNVKPYFQEIFSRGVPRFIPRSQAENDPGYKQIIPYVIMGCDGKYLNYVRGKRAGETRLVGNRSMGIGGHINPPDQTLFSQDFYDTYIEAVNREVEEEVAVQTGYRNHIVALINDESNEVGKVHFGVVHFWSLDEPEVAKKEQMITQLEFSGYDELAKVSDTMETWSSLCLDSLQEIERNKENCIEVSTSK